MKKGGTNSGILHLVPKTALALRDGKQDTDYFPEVSETPKEDLTNDPPSPLKC